MKVLNFGSLNIDYVYMVDHLVKCGETIKCESYHKYCGGKGLNQSIALAYAGMDVYHAGRVGSDGRFLIDCLIEANVKTRYVVLDEESISGHAIIQVDKRGQNSILLHGGANQEVSEDDINKTLSAFSEGDYLLLQNEICKVESIIRVARKRGMKIVFNPAPMDERVRNFPLDLVDILIVNEVEGFLLSKEESPELIIENIAKENPNCIIVLTLGEKGSMVYKKGVIYKKEANKSVKIIDTTAAGDTFIGYLVYGLSKGMNVEEVLTLATNASALCITRIGAAGSIPKMNEVLDF